MLEVTVPNWSTATSTMLPSSGPPTAASSGASPVHTTTSATTDQAVPGPAPSPAKDEDATAVPRNDDMSATGPRFRV